MIAERYYEHLALRAALWELGAATVSIVAAQAPHQLPLIKPDLMLFGRESGSPPEGATVVGDDWWQGPAPDRWVTPRRPLRPDDAAHITVSSGTTGTPKQILVTREMMDFRVFNIVASLGVGFEDRILAMMGLDTTGGALAPLAAWMMHGAVTNSSQTLTDITRPRSLRPTIVLASPVQLQAIVAALPPDSAPMPWLTVGTGGSVLPEKVAELVRKRLSTRLQIGYGSSEALSVSAGPPGPEGASGYVVPWAEVRITGPDGEDLPPGEIGEVWVRTPQMPTSYRDDEDLTRKGFTDGWFRPGDLGSLTEDGLLTITGRTGEMINAGGVKIAYRTLEETALEHPGVSDAGACEMPGRSGLVEPWLGLMVGEDFDAAALKARLKARFPTLQVRTAVLTEVPRNRMGKIPRDELVEAIRAQAGEA